MKFKVFRKRLSNLVSKIMDTKFMFYFIVSEAIAVNTTSEELFTAVSTES